VPTRGTPHALRGHDIFRTSRMRLHAHSLRSKKLAAIILFVIGLAIATGAAAIYTQLSGSKAKKDTRDAVGAIPIVAVIPVTRADLSEELSLSAEFRPFQEVNVYAKVNGYVRQMNVDVGARVRAGDIIAILEIPELQDDLRRASAAVERADQEVARTKATYEDAHLTYTRLSEVLKQQPNLVAQQDIDEAHARDESGKATWVAAQSAVREAIANRAKYTTMIAYSRITAPFAGVITKRYADTGSLVGAGTASSTQALVRLSQLDPLRLVLPVPESAVPTVRDGALVEVQVQATRETIAAKVSRTSGEVATSTRTMHVEVDVPNRDLRLAPGMYATATLVQESRKNALTIPVETAPNRKGDIGTVYVLNRNHKIEERTVKVGLETPTQLEVKSGLEEHELVLIGGRGQYQPGQMAAPKLLAKETAR
jgi:RND family efflux transporter MFP subunit